MVSSPDSFGVCERSIYKYATIETLSHSGSRHTLKNVFFR